MTELSGASTKSMQLSVTWRCPIDGGADVCDVGPKQMDDDVCSNKPWQFQLLAQLPPKFQSGDLSFAKTSSRRQMPHIGLI